jgi:hypothetical protein
MNVKRGLSGEEEGKERILRGEENGSTLCIHT